MVRILKCSHCGCTFPNFVQRGRPPKYCSTCAQTEYSNVKTRQEKVCAFCGVSFRGTLRQRCCSYVCANRKRRADDGTSVGFQPCRVCGLEYKPHQNNNGGCCSIPCGKIAAAAHSAGRQKWFKCAHCGQQFKNQRNSRTCNKFCSQECTWKAARSHGCNHKHGGRAIAAHSSSHEKKARLLGRECEQIDPLVVFERDGWMCGLCRRPVSQSESWPSPLSASLDHVVPFAKGGHHTFDNVQCSHLGCNLLKGASMKVLVKAKVSGQYPMFPSATSKRC